MLSIDDFALREKTQQSITIVFVPTGQSFRFQAVDGRVTFGEPLVEGQKSKHPPWLIAWLARKVAQQGVPLEDHCGVVPVPFAPALEPAVPIKRSIQHDYLVCLEDGAKLKMLQRHLARFGLTPDTYRARWGLPKDYPMVAPAYAAERSAIAKQFGLGSALPPHTGAVRTGGVG